MHPASYYRERADNARRVTSRMHQPNVVEVLRQVARDDDIADDLDGGTIEIRHSKLMPQRGSAVPRTGLICDKDWSCYDPTCIN